LVVDLTPFLAGADPARVLFEAPYAFWGPPLELRPYVATRQPLLNASFALASVACPSRRALLQRAIDEAEAQAVYPRGGQGGWGTRGASG
jgi:hypothetical protein